MNIKDFAAIYLGRAQIYNADQTIYNKRIYVERYADYFGDKDLAEIKRADIERYIAHRKLFDAGNPTINRELSALKNLFNYGIQLGYLESNPVKGVRLLPERRKPLRLPTTAEVEHYLVWCMQNDPLLYDLSVIAVNTGLRRGDILKIRGEDIDAERRILAVAVSKTRALHYIPLNDTAHRVLSRRKNRSGIGYIFINGITHIKGFRRRFNRAKKATGLSCRFHDFRHYFATEVHRLGANIRTVQELLGHSRIETTRRYTAIVDNDRRRAVNLLQGVTSNREFTLFEM